MQALWKGHVIADSNNTILVEGNHYFPEDCVNQDLLRPSSTTTHCHWKGTAHYHHLEVAGERLADAAWYYPEPFPEARRIAAHIAFWNGVEVLVAS